MGSCASVNVRSEFASLSAEEQVEAQNCFDHYRVNGFSEEDALQKVVSLVKKRKAYQLSDAFDGQISTNADFLAFASDHKLTSHNQYQWKCKINFMMSQSPGA